MKVEPELKNKELTEFNIQQEKKYQLKLKGKIKPHPGHILFEIDLSKAVIEAVPATYQKIAYIFNPFWQTDSKIAANKKVIIKPDCVYISAMNATNALKHFYKYSNGSKL
jgi:hypothetical protein